MTCTKCKTSPVWTFTNQTQLCKNCFNDYIERKVWKTIRKFNMLPKDKIFRISGTSLNSKVLKHILEKKFPVKPGKDVSSENLSESAEKVFSNAIKGKFNQVEKNKPLYYVSDAEIELYSKLNDIKGKSRIQNKNIQSLFKKFPKNPDLERNIVNASEQLD